MIVPQGRPKVTTTHYKFDVNQVPLAPSAALYSSGMVLQNLLDLRCCYQYDEKICACVISGENAARNRQPRKELFYRFKVIK